MPRTVPAIVTSSDGSEMRFPSVKSAGQFIGIPGGRVSNMCVMGNSIRGYRVRYESKNKMGQLMEADNADCPMRADYCPVVDVPGVCRFEEREETHD